MSSQQFLIGQRGEASQEVTRALVPARVVIQVQLVVLLCIPPLPRGQDLRHHAALPPLLVDLFRNLARLLLLLGIVVENRAAVLATCVRALAVRRGRIVHFVEEFEEGAVCYFLGVVDYLERFGVFISRC
jgi:hypothetical protein